MPGVNVTTSTRSGAANPNVPSSGRYFAVGQCERGSTTEPIKIRSLGEYELLCGSRVTYGFLYDAAKMYFGDGGGEMYIARVVGTTPVKSTITLVDRAGSPLSTIRVDAKNPGQWANGWTVNIAAGTLASTVKVTLSNSAAAVVETWDNLADVAAICARTSAYVTFTNLLSATAAPNNLPAVGTFTLASGTDDRATVTGASYVAGLALFTKDLEAGMVDVPGIAGTTAASASTVGAGLQAHAIANDRICVINPAVTDSRTQAMTLAQTFTTTTADGAMVGWPWAEMIDGTATRDMSLGPYMAAVRARAHSDYFPSQPAAGEFTRSKTISRLKFPVTDAELELANAAGVSVARTIGGTVQMYGWRSLSTDTDNYYFASRRDALNTLSFEARRRLRRFLFQTIDSRGQLAMRVENEVLGMIAGWAARGGFWELKRNDGVRTVNLDPGYAVKISYDGVQQNKLIVTLYVRFAPAAEVIEVQIVNLGLTAAAN